jgi:hypothetical protein
MKIFHLHGPLVGGCRRVVVVGNDLRLLHLEPEAGRGRQVRLRGWRGRRLERVAVSGPGNVLKVVCRYFWFNTVSLPTTTTTISQVVLTSLFLTTTTTQEQERQHRQLHQQKQ